MWRGICLWLVLALPAYGQDSEVFRSPILVVDRERLLDTVGVPPQVARRIENRQNDRIEEGRRIEAELEAEELELTAKRPTLTPEEFRALADAFDAKVERIRAEQVAKDVALQRYADEELFKFRSQISPILAQIMQERSALAVLDRRAVLISIDAIDVTDEAIARIKMSAETGPNVEDPSTPDEP